MPTKNAILNIAVVGCGGGGVNAVNRMIDIGIDGVEYCAFNTDAQALIVSNATVKLDIGRNTTGGLGAGANPEVGEKAALESYSEIKEILEGADMVFVTAGMGGGTGTGSVPIVARAAKEVGALVIGIVTTPFGFEGKQRMLKATSGIEKLKNEVDTLIVIPNDNLLSMLDPRTTMQDAFVEADMMLMKGVAAITDLITTPGEINIDFADVKRIMTNAGTAFMGIGSGVGQDRADIAVKFATSSPILDIDLRGAKGVLLSIKSSSNIEMQEISQIASVVSEQAHEEADIIFGTVQDQSLGDEIIITVIATGFGNE
ncbi:MAG: cell division protein FtsZ [Sediminibacterium sp.]